MLDRKAEASGLHGREVDERGDCERKEGEAEAEGLTGVCRGTWASRLGGDPWGGGRGRSTETGRWSGSPATSAAGRRGRGRGAGMTASTRDEEEVRRRGNGVEVATE